MSVAINAIPDVLSSTFRFCCFNLVYIASIRPHSLVSPNASPGMSELFKDIPEFVEVSPTCLRWASLTRYIRSP
jgi:hypothetical protein